MDRPGRSRAVGDGPGGGAEGRHRDREREVRVMRGRCAVLLFLLFAADSAAGQAPRAFPTSDAPFRTHIDVNRWHGYDELVADMERLQRAFPKFLTVSSIGKSVEGRDIKVM